MSGDIIQLNPEAFQSELKGLVKNSIEETLNAMLDEEANLCFDTLLHLYTTKSIQQSQKA